MIALKLHGNKIVYYKNIYKGKNNKLFVIKIYHLKLLSGIVHHKRRTVHKKLYRIFRHNTISIKIK